jgi:hypothetical protein
MRLLGTGLSPCAKRTDEGMIVGTAKTVDDLMNWRLFMNTFLLEFRGLGNGNNIT